MSKNEVTSSSSEDEITIAAVREACDEKFLPQSLFCRDNSGITTPLEFELGVKDKQKPSLRSRESADNFESFGVSQSFKDYVAKKLDVILDRNIIDDDVNNSEVKCPKKRKIMKKKISLKNNHGIKLLSSSNEILSKVEEPKEKKPTRLIKPWKFTRENESTNMIKCQEVAVDSNWILSKAETKYWNERQKGAIFKYKKGSKGTLIEQQ